MEPKVSIIVPIYNGEVHIDTCVGNLVRQAYTNMEIILVDDGSKDNTGAICDKWAEQDSRVRVVHKINEGVSIARNTGVQNATGKYIYFCDVDDAVENNLLQDNVPLAEENNADVVMFCFWYYGVEEDELIPNALEVSYAGDAEGFFRKALIPAVKQELINAPWNKLIRREFLLEHDLKFDSSFAVYEDLVFSVALLNRAENIVVNNQMYYRYFFRSFGTAITGFHKECFDSISQAYKNALDYCQKYVDSEKQLQTFRTLYMKLSVMHIKQIVCKTDLNRGIRDELLNKIFESPLLAEALDGAELNWKKKVIRFLIKHKCKCIIALGYRLSSAFGK